MKIPLTPFTRCALVSSTLLIATFPCFAANVYLTPGGAGSQNGSSWANAYAQAQIQTAISALAAGDTLNLGSGTYSALNVSITGSGVAGSVKSIVGVDTGGGLPLFEGTWSETAPGSNPAGAAHAFRFNGTARYWVLKDIRVKKKAQAIAMSSSGTFSDLTIDNVDADTVRDGIAVTEITNSVIKNCDVVRHTKKGFRLTTAVNFVTFENCTADANGGNDTFPNEAFPNGFYSDSASSNRDNTFIDCVARNQRMPNQPNSYWNGDGFSSEGSSSNYRYIRCKAFDNHDAGFDDKARSTTYDSCVAIGNKRGFRYWGATNGLMINCLSAYNQSWGDTDPLTGQPMESYALWVAGNLNVSQSTFHNAVVAQVHADPGADVILNDCILSVDGVFASGAMTSGSGNLTLNATKQYSPGAGGPDVNPNYVAPSRNWTSTPANAFDSQAYANPEKGYFQASGVANVPPLLALAATPYTAGMVPLTVNFTATPTETDGMIVSYAWTFGDGGTSTAQNPTYIYTAAGTYVAECTITDNSGAIAKRRVTIQVIKANAGPNHYVTPAGAGSRNGSSWANAYAETELQALVNEIAAGDTVHLGSGTYAIGPSITLTKSGTSASPITIQGVDTGGGLPLFDAGFNVANNASSGLFSFGTGAMSYLTIKNLQFKNQGWVIDMRLTGTTDTLRDHITFENLAFDTIEDGIRLRNCNNVLVRNCHAVRYTKKAFRIGDYSSFVTVENCSADCTGGNLAWAAKAIPTGFFMDDTDAQPTIHDITFTDCVARNNGYIQADDDYWNGDGFSSEKAAYNISYIRCESYDNNDGGFDDKANHLLIRDCIAAGNKRQYRIWSTDVVLDNCIAAHAQKSSATGGDGGTGATGSLWLDDTGRATVQFSTFHNGIIETTSGALVTVEDSILSRDASTTTFTSGSGITLVRTEKYSPSIGTDPQYIAPSSGWRGSPVNAYDSALYGLTKGFNSSYLGAVISVNVSNSSDTLGASDVAGAVPVANWNNSTTTNQLVSNLLDNTGATTAASMKFVNTPYGYANSTVGTTGDAKMMRGQRGESNESWMSAEGRDVPYATYDVYVYWGGRKPSESVPKTMTVEFQLWNGSAWVTSETKFIKDSDHTWDGTYNESTATTAAAAVDGNEYVVFRGATATKFKVLATGGLRTGISGIQIAQQ